MNKDHGIIKTQAQDFIKAIRLLAQSGKSSFTRFLYDPLDSAGWSSSRQEQSVRKLLEHINTESNNPAYLHTVAPRCKRAVSYAMAENLASLGDASIFFLEKMQIHEKIAKSPESLEFTTILSDPLTEFGKLTNEKSEVLFKEAVYSINNDELKKAIEPIRLFSSDEKVKLAGEIKRLYDNILIASRYNNLLKCRKLLSHYIINYVDDEDYARQDVERLINALNKREIAFQSELSESIAIDLYYRITKSVHASDIYSAIRYIRKYGYIFEGNPETRYFFEIDRLERILYQMISEKGIWQEMKK